MDKAKKRKLAILAVLLAVFLASAAMAVRQQLQYRQIAEDSEQAAEIAGLHPQGGAAGDGAPTAQPSGSPTQPEASQPPVEGTAQPREPVDLAALDLAALRAVNPDVIGWIEIPGTAVSYPLVQRGDNQFYLSHNWRQRASSGGSIFMETTSNPDLTGFHTIIYGHRMYNNSMFGTLKYYDQADFLQAHPSVYLRMDDGIYRYDIFSARKASVTGIVYRLDLESRGLQEEFIQSCVEESVVDGGPAPAADDRILTLSTCTSVGHADRWVVHAVLREVQPVE